jgi:hypothetical protein
MKWYQSIVLDKKGAVGRVEVAQIHLAVNNLNFCVLLADGSVIDVDVAFPANNVSSALRVLYVLFLILGHPGYSSCIKAN